MEALARRAPGERWTDAQGVHIDVRGLVPPAPLVQILSLVDALPGATDVIVHHDRNPALLYAELAQRGWSVETMSGDAGEVRLRLRGDG